MTYPGSSADAIWRSLVFPSDYRNPTPADRYNLVVIGAGPAGLIIAIAAAGLGAKVALIEKHRMGGDCLNVGCVPSKTLLAAASAGLGFERAMARVREVRAAISHHDSVQRYTQAGVDVFLGAAEFVAADRVRVGDLTLAARKFVVATGARAFVPPVPGLAEHAQTNESIFELREQPRRLAVLGGGPIGCELAQAFARLGTQVHLIEMQTRLLPMEDEDASRAVQRALAADGVKLYLGTKVTAVSAVGTAKRLAYQDAAGDEKVNLEVDVVLAAVGRKRNVEGLGLDAAGVRFDPRSGIEVDAHLRTSQRHIFAAGDVCSKYQFTHMADAQARIVVRNALFFGRARVDELVVPWCTYTKPEVAHVGATRGELAQSRAEYLPLRFEFADLDRGRTDARLDPAGKPQSDGYGDGYAELLVDRKSSRILGATIVGKDAGEQLAPIILAMNTHTGLKSLGALILPYPTRSEYLRRLVDAWNRTRLTPRTAGLLAWWLRRTR
ncbi:MAG TPA: FAD-dependent oxidoreductase [Steroidobacteraceae bacterium]|nr:FAD-dependent oxidoreductase [Steroidobacteraceae bacterium]